MYKVKGSSDAPQSKHYTQFSAMLSGLESETEYEVSVYTYCDDHLSTEAVSTTFTTPAPLCPNPTNIHVSELTAYTALIEWTPGSLDNLNWNVKYYCTSTPDELIVVDASEGPWYLLTDLTPDTEYGVSVMSLCDGETGPGFTTPITFRTMDNLPTGLEQTIEQTIQVRKVLINGQLFILRDGVQYNIMGIRVSTLGY